MFDETGRLIPLADSVVYSKVSRRYFTLAQPKLDLAAIYSRFDKHLHVKNFLSQKEFSDRCQKILDRVKQDPKTKNLLKGIHVPFICLNLTEDAYLKAVGESFKEMFPQYTFTNHCASAVESGHIAPGSRYEKLLETRKKSAVVGWYFPNCLAEYSVPSQRDAVSHLPESLMLNGIVDSASAFIGSPDLLMKNQDNLYPHLLCAAAVAPPDEKFFYHFEAYGWNLTFNYRSYVGAVAEYWAGGLSIID